MTQAFATPAQATETPASKSRASKTQPTPTQPKPANPALRITDLSVKLGGRTVLKNVNLALEPGTLMGLLGPNGAGKTTLIRSILGVQKLESGTIRHAQITPVARQTVAPPRTPATPNIGYVPQKHEFAWEFPLSVANTVLTGLNGKMGWWGRPTAQDWGSVRNALERVELLNLADRPIGQLSGGQRQRVLVARALVRRPTLLLLDEPHTGVDLPTQESLNELFVSLAREGHAVLMSTHDIPAALLTCDRVALLMRTVTAVGTPRELAADTEVWCQTFGVSAHSPFIKTVQVAL